MSNLNNNSQEVLNAILRTDFKAFVRKVFDEVSGADEYKDNWHIDKICSFVTDVIDGSFNRGIINIPPRSLKSIICSIALPAFLLGHNPRTRIICASYSDEFALKLAGDCIRVIQSHWYQELFPATKLIKFAKGDFETTLNGGRFSASINGGVTGRGADWVIVDDPLKPSDSFSTPLRERVNEWYRSTLLTRLNDKKNGKIIVVMQRLHENDLSGYILDTDSSYHHVKLSMIAEQNEMIRINPLSKSVGEFIERNIGDLLHPERDDLEVVKKLRSDLGEYAFSGQYQQNPAPVGGGIIKREKLHFYIPPKTPGFARIILSWDTASKIGLNNAYSACVTIGETFDNKYYVLDCVRDRLEFSPLLNRAADLYERAKKEYRCACIEIIVEDASSGTQLIQELKNVKGITAIPIKADKDKIVRFAGLTPQVENGDCLFPSVPPVWWQDFESELLTFPFSKFKDQCDALAQGIEYLKLNKVKRQSSVTIRGFSGSQFEYSFIKPHRKQKTDKTGRRLIDIWD